MKLLKIEDSQGLFLSGEGTFTPLDKATKDDLLRLVELTLTKEVEMDEYDSEAIKNQAHQILYKSVSEKLGGLRDRKEAFTDESERLYLKEYERYREDPSQQPAGGDGEPSPQP